jgi:hypothetical protein
MSLPLDLSRGIASLRENKTESDSRDTSRAAMLRAGREQKIFFF